MTDAPRSFILSNARVVLARELIDRGWIAVSDGRIAEIGSNEPPERGIDLASDLLIPGLVELHTDHLEAHYIPRPKVHWNAMAAVLSYDAQIAASGITTVFDSLRICRADGAEDADGQHDVLAEALASARKGGFFRADHLLHLRCEFPMTNVVPDAAAMLEHPEVRLISLMDHTPGQRQFRNEEKLRTYYRGKGGGLTDAELDAIFAERIRLRELHAADNWSALVALAKARNVTLASHDDTLIEHVEQAVAAGIAIGEFPTTREAAEALHGSGIKVMMGAPNLVRGGSHSGNIATSDLAEAGILDIMSSDYVPSSLLFGALMLADKVKSFDLPSAINTVTKTPAEAVGLRDRGEIAVGRRADLVRVHTEAEVPVACTVWREGQRIA